MTTMPGICTIDQQIPAYRQAGLLRREDSKISISAIAQQIPLFVRNDIRTNKQIETDEQQDTVT